MTIVVPVIMLLGILWALYDRECALALTVLGASLFVLWGVRRYGSSMYVGTTVKVCVVIYLVLLAALAALTKSGKLNKLLPPKADKLPVYAACGLSALALLASLLGGAGADGPELKLDIADPADEIIALAVVLTIDAVTESKGGVSVSVSSN